MSQNSDKRWSGNRTLPDQSVLSPHTHDMTPGMNILITGGRGGIGREICQAFRGDGVARLVTLGRQAVSASDPPAENVHHETGSVHDGEFLKRVIGHHHITHIIHAAGARTRDCEADAQLAHAANVRGTECVFLAAEAAGSVKKIIHLSSAAVYGRCRQPVTEDQPIAPTTNYAITKAGSETIARDHTAAGAFQTVILRPGFVLGPRTGGSLNRFIARAFHGSAAHLHFIGHFHLHWAPDLAATMVRLLQGNWPLNCLTVHPPGSDVPIHHFIATVREAAAGRGAMPQLSFTLDEATPLPSRLDGSRFQQIFGQTPLTSLPAMICQVGEELQMTAER